MYIYHTKYHHGNQVYANFEVSHPVLNRTCNITTTSFTFPENNQASCEMFQFSVTASNPAGDSVPTIIQDTIPICEFVRPGANFMIRSMRERERGRVFPSTQL